MLEPAERNGARQSRRLDDLVLVALAFAVVAALFGTQATARVDLRDEGYLWYGAIAVTKGQVPLRDFQAYDPGRYYWAAPWLMLLDGGIVPLRIACAAFHFPGVLCGLLVLRRLTRAWSTLAPAALLLTLWLFPPYMLNHTVALVGMWVAVLVIERPSPLRHLLAGVYVGLAAFFGRNLGLYAVVSFSVLLGVVWWRIERRDLARRLLALGAGVLLGYSPMLVMLLAVPGFAAGIADSLRYLAAAGSTNLPFPVPWPWRASSPFEASVGVFFVLCPPFYGVAATTLWRATKEELVRWRVLLASTVVGVPYLHYAFSRADIQHLGMAIHPFLLGVLALPFLVGRRRRPLALGVLAAVGAASLMALVRVHPLYIRATAPAGWYVPETLGRWTVWAPWHQARFIDGTIRFNAAMVAPDEGFLIAPHVGPGLYAILNRDSPVWQLYFLSPAPDWSQRRMIDQLERNRVNWVLLEDVRTDGHEELRFRHTHRLMWEHIEGQFEAFPVDGLPPDFSLLRRRMSAPPPP